MFNVGSGELIVIFLVALIVLGPDKLPDAVRRVGRVMGELKRMSDGFQAEVRDALAEPIAAVQDTARAAQDGFTSAMTAATSGFDPAVPSTATVPTEVTVAADDRDDDADDDLVDEVPGSQLMQPEIDDGLGDDEAETAHHVSTGRIPEPPSPSTWAAAWGAAPAWGAPTGAPAPDPFGTPAAEPTI